MIKVLNLYAGIGGNRKLWKDVEVTAVENVPEIAEIYKDFFPDDEVIVADAHKYLLEHYKEYNFIWSSPPCITHTRMNYLLKVKGKKMVYPDLKLYEEIIFLQHWFKGCWVVENVFSYYKPLIKPQVSGRHFFWSNFKITNKRIAEKVTNDKGVTLKVKMRDRDFIVKDFHGYKGDKRTLLNNIIEPELGLHVFNSAFKEQQKTL